MSCQVCGCRFAARRDARFCSTRCRVWAHRHRSSGPPRELCRLDRWVLFDSRKVPRRVDRPSWPASSTDPASWSSFNSASAAVGSSGFACGVGFVLTGDGVCAIDLDHCINPDGSLEPFAREILARCPRTYVEVSPSGTGLHIFGFGHVGGGRRMDGVEVYDRGRYMTVTGQAFRDFPRRLAKVQPLVDSLL